MPPPRVDSVVILFEARPGRLTGDRDRDLVRTARAAFSQRRKTLKNSLTAGLGAPSPGIVEALVAAGIDPTARAETLGLADFDRLAQALAARKLLDAQTGISLAADIE